MKLSATRTREWISNHLPHRGTRSGPSPALPPPLASLAARSACRAQSTAVALPEPIDLRAWTKVAGERLPVLPTESMGQREGTHQVWTLGVLEPGKFAIFGFEEDAELKEGEIRVQTLHSGWSAGTEGTILGGKDARGNEDLDNEAALFRKKSGESEPAYPRPVIGYMEVGVVVDSKRPGVKKGDVLCGTWGHKTSHTYKASEKMFIKLPAGVDPIVGILGAHMGPICANGLAHADRALRFEMTDAQIAKRQLGRGVAQILGKKEVPGKELAGRNVVVFGAGIVGLVTGMMAKSAGANVAIVDMDAGRLARAEKLGLIPLDASQPDFDPALHLKDELGWKTKRGTPGADVAFQCTAQSSALHSAMRCVGRQQPVIDLGYYTGGANDLYLGKEFHHFGLLHICAQVGNMLSDWPRERLREYTVRFLEEHGPAIKEHIITDDVAFAEAGDFILSLRERPNSFQVAMHP